MMHEDRQAICDAFLATLLLTNNAGNPGGNPLKELRYIPEKEVVRPIFADGSGNDGYYDVYVDGDSGTAMVTDITRQFITSVW